MTQTPARAHQQVHMHYGTDFVRQVKKKRGVYGFPLDSMQNS